MLIKQYLGMITKKKPKSLFPNLLGSSLPCELVLANEKWNVAHWNFPSKRAGSSCLLLCSFFPPSAACDTDMMGIPSTATLGHKEEDQSFGAAWQWAVRNVGAWGRHRALLALGAHFLTLCKREREAGTLIRLPLFWDLGIGIWTQFQWPQSRIN